MNSDLLTKKITDLIFEKKGFDVKVLELQKVTTLTDYFVLCSASSDTQVKAIADHIEQELKKEGIRLWHKEGYKALSWVLLDYVDVVIHIFRAEQREYYNLEKLWGDAPMTIVTDPALLKKSSAKKL